jgi:hypothetical protein
VEHSGKPHVVVISLEKYEQLLAAREEQEDWSDGTSFSRSSSICYGRVAGTGRWQDSRSTNSGKSSDRDSPAQ